MIKIVGLCGTVDRILRNLKQVLHTQKNDLIVKETPDLKQTIGWLNKIKLINDWLL